MLQILKKYDRAISIAGLAISILLSLGVLFIPLDPKELAAYGYGGVLSSLYWEQRHYSSQVLQWSQLLSLALC